jgi:hypothetical protein
MASFLFLGPTGVGKTQCAKTIAAYLYGSEEKLIRFDMNEYVEPWSASRLVGTFAEPDGLLTSRVERQPFSVVLLDEIEKAHPDVFDLLLQVLGEGRLTDALGRTVDFTNAIIILTSNLGVREAGTQFGFGDDDRGVWSVYVQAAERFFRPEFFNRLDRIIPFNRLGRDQVRQIARLVIQRVFDREGLVRRRCVLDIDPQAMEKVVEEAYNPLLGARALKRAVERQIAQPVASYLVSVQPETPTVVSLLPARRGVATQVEAIVDAVPSTRSAVAVDLSDPRRVLERVAACADTLRASTLRWRPPETITADNLRPEHHRYFTVQELLERIQRGGEALAERLSARRPRMAFPVRGTAGYRVRRLGEYGEVTRRVLMEMYAAKDIREFLHDLAGKTVPPRDRTEADLLRLLREYACARTVAQAEPAGDRVVVYLRGLSELRAEERQRLCDLYRTLFTEEFGFEVCDLRNAGAFLGPREEAILVAGAQNAAGFAGIEEGTHMFCPPHRNLVLVQVKVFRGRAGEDGAAILARRVAERNDWRASLHRDPRSAGEDPFPFDPVIRVYDEAGPTVDLRTGLAVRRPLAAADLKTFMLSQIPLPEVFSD